MSFLKRKDYCTNLVNEKGISSIFLFFLFMKFFFFILAKNSILIPHLTYSFSY